MATIFEPFAKPFFGVFMRNALQLGKLLFRDLNFSKEEKSFYK